MSYTHQLPSNTEGYYDPQPMDKSKDNPNNLDPQKTSPTKQSASPESNPLRSTVTYIPGLPLESMNTMPKKTQKRRKKKTKTDSSIVDCDSANKELEYLKHSPSFGFDHFPASYDQKVPGECVSDVQVEPIHEIQLTDDLADSLVNPPTDLEASDEEETHQCPLIGQEAPQNLNNKDNANEFELYTETHVVDDSKDGLNEMEVEDEEICKITENIKEIVSLKDGYENKNTLLVDVISEQKANNYQEHECRENIIECISVTSSDGQSKSFDKKIKIEDAINEEECEHKVHHNGEDTIPGSKNQIKKSKRSKKSKKSTIETENGFLKREHQIVHESIESPAELKKSYSSVIKSNLVKESNNNPTISSQPKVEIVPIPTPMPTTPNLSAIQIQTEQDSDNWEKVPLAISKPGSWEKTSKKRKHKNKSIKFEDFTTLTGEIPDLEVVAKIKEPSQPKEVIKVFEKETIQEDENAKEDDIEQEKKRMRRRKKKNGSEDPEEINVAHKIVICDDQVNFVVSSL